MKTYQLLLVSSCLLLSACEPALQQPRSGSYPAQADSTPMPASADQQLREKVRQLLVNDPTLQTANISVDVVEGAVVLGGEVLNSEQAAQAMRLAQQTAGVLTVNNNMVVRQQ